MVKVLHAADFHLDSAFGALPEEKARLRRRESRGIPARLVEWANDHGAQLMLLAGDLFDSDNLYGQTAQELADALGRFRGRVFIAPGNHDFYAAHGPWGAAAWPENVRIFTSGRPVCVDEPELGCAVWGAAFTAAEEADGSALTAVHCPDDGRTHLMVLHADLSAPDSRYRPITPAQIGETGLSYLALGHTHAFSGVLHAGRTTFAYPGCPEGRGFDELGEKGFLFGEVGPDGADMAFVPFARRHYQILRADVTDAAPLDAVERLLPLQTQEDIYRIILTGERTEDFSLTALQSRLEDRFFQLELRDETRAPEDLWARCGEDSLRGLFLQEMHRQLESAAPEDRAAIEQAVRFGLAAMDHRDL